MADNTQVKFYKGAYGATEATSKSTTNKGGIVFDTTSKSIYVNGVAFGGNITDVTFGASADGKSQQTLTITKAVGEAITLDFSDTASATATMNVFSNINKIIGKDMYVQGGTATGKLNYSGANYLNGYTEGETTVAAVTTLVDADMRLDALIKAINDEIAAMNATNIQSMTQETDASGDVTLTFKGTSETDGKIEQGTGTDTLVLKKVATTAAATDLTVTSAKYGGTENTTNAQTALNNLSQAITDANITIDGQKGEITSGNGLVPLTSTNKAMSVKAKSGDYISVTADGVALDSTKIDSTYDTTGTSDLATVATVTAGIATLKNDGETMGSIADGNITINGIKEANGIVSADSSKATTIAYDGTYNATSNKLATQSTVTNAIDGLNVTAYNQATIAENKISIANIQESKGLISSTTTTDIAVDGTVSDTNPLATKATIQGLKNTGETMSSETDGVVTLYKQITETDGIIDIDSADTNKITLAKVATTGSASDVTVNYTAKGASEATSTDTQAAVTGMTNRIADLEALPTYDTVVSTDAATTPEGISWKSGETTITGTLAASASTMHKIYLVPETTTSTQNIYGEYITIKNGSTYSWEKLGTTALDLTGYVKTITVNGKEFAVTEGTTNVVLPNAITAITGETATGTNTDYVKVEASTVTPETADGSKTTTLTTKAKVQAVSTSGDSAKGLAEASDVKSYVDTTVQGLAVDAYEQASVTSTASTNVQTVKVYGIKEENGEIAHDSSKDTTISNVVIDSEYDTVKANANSALQSISANNTTGSYVTTTVSEKGTGTTQTVGVELTYAAYNTDKTAITSDGVAKGSDVVAVSDAIAKADIAAIASTSKDDTDAGVKVTATTAAGSISSVDVAVTGATVTYNATDKTLTIDDSTKGNVVTGADLISTKSYIDAQDAATKTTVSAAANSAITVTGTAQSDGHTDYAVGLVWEEWEEEA